jgi:DNA-binding transcriptional LysR family regulator
MDNRLIEMEVFVRTADRGSLTAAASELGISAQMAGRYLRHLEQRLGVTLVVRATRHQYLSEAGLAFLERSRSVLAAAQDAEDAARAFGRRPAGSLRIAAPIGYGSNILAPLLAEFLAKFPQITVDVRLSDTMLDPVAERVDVAIRIGELSDSALIARALPAYELALCASRSYLDRYGTPEGEQHCANHPWIEYRFPRRAPRDVSRLWEGVVPPIPARQVILRFDDIRAVIAAVIAGAGVAILPRILVRDQLAAGTLGEIGAAHVEHCRPMHLVYPVRALAPAARAFVDWFLVAAR